MNRRNLLTAIASLFALPMGRKAIPSRPPIQTLETMSVSEVAYKLRVGWMNLLGFSDDDIRYHCEHDPPTDADAELMQFNAIEKIKRGEDEPRNAKETRRVMQ